MEIKIKTQSAEETMAVGEKLAKSLFSPCVVSLAGDLGAGKTTFCKGFARGLGIDENITSPTFTLMNEYAGEKKLYHFDLYRLSTEDELYEAGLVEYIESGVGISVVEWPDILSCDTSGDIYDVYISKNLEIDENYREIEVKKRDTSGS